MLFLTKTKAQILGTAQAADQVPHVIYKSKYLN